MTLSIGEICKKLDSEKLEKLTMELENELRKYLQQNMPPKIGFDIVISLTKRNEELELAIDIRVDEGPVNIIDYEQIINDAINHVKRRFKSMLEEVVTEQ